MCLYFGPTSLGPGMQLCLWWKQQLANLQLGQFVTIAAHSSYNLFIECSFPDGFRMAILLYTLSLIAFVFNVYHQTHLRRS
ncbi:hypothetical protein HJG60_010184 [Phyllostomus discolor]|nr:hypothetical protein HJG60_010184 [Phyllostomus discolor]